MRDVEWRRRDDAGARIGAPRVDVAVGEARGEERAELRAEEHVGAARAADAAADDVFVAREADEVAIALVVELDARDSLVFAELPAERRTAAPDIGPSAAAADPDAKYSGSDTWWYSPTAAVSVASPSLYAAESRGSTVRTWVKLE